jgi:predicted transcriptional regulator
METIQKDVIEKFVNSIYLVSSRRTTIKYAEQTLIDALNSLKDQFELFKDIKFSKDKTSDSGFQVEFSNTYLNLQTKDIANALESLIRLIYEDISEESGLYFITEIKNYLEKKSVDMILGIGVNLDQIQREQHFKYAQRKKKNQQKESGKIQNPLGYTWKSVSKWEYNSESKQVFLYDSSGNKLDEISLEKAIKSYVEKISGIAEFSSLDLQNLLEEHEKSYTFLKLVYSENIDFETAKKMLNLSDKEIYEIIKNLIELKLLKYVSDDEIEITSSGKDFISK